MGDWQKEEVDRSLINLRQENRGKLPEALWDGKAKAVRATSASPLFSLVAYALFGTPIKWNIGVSYARIVGAVFFAFKY